MAQLELAHSLETGFSEEAGLAMIAKAKALRPLLELHAQRNEDGGELSPAVVAALDEAGFWHMAVPRRWGGLSISAQAMARTVSELAKGCPSSAWVISIMNSNVWMASLMPDAVQEDVFGKGIPRVAGVGTPAGTARRVSGGFVINGRWGYGSGSHHAEWIYCQIADPDGGEGPGGMFIAPAGDLEIVNSWSVAGMKGTGSDTIAANELFVPEHRVVLFRDGGMGQARSGARHTGEVTDHWTVIPLLRSKGLGVMVGAVEALLEVTLSSGNSARPIVHTNYRHKIDSPVFQAGLGEAATWVRAAGILMDTATRLIDRAALEERPTTYEERTLSRGDAALSIQLLGKAADKLMNLLGSSGFATSSPAQRYWRDYNIASRHVVNLPEVGFEVLGKALLGIPASENITVPDFI